MDKGTINVGNWEDTGEPVLTIDFDTTPGPCQDSIWIDKGSNIWLSFDEQHAEELCRAILIAAIQIRKNRLARLKENTK